MIDRAFFPFAIALAWGAAMVAAYFAVNLLRRLGWAPTDDETVSEADDEAHEPSEVGPAVKWLVEQRSDARIDTREIRARVYVRKRVESVPSFRSERLEYDQALRAAMRDMWKVKGPDVGSHNGPH